MLSHLIETTREELYKSFREVFALYPQELVDEMILITSDKIAQSQLAAYRLGVEDAKEAAREARRLYGDSHPGSLALIDRDALISRLTTLAPDHE